MAASSTCAHCGLPAPEVRDALSFCCPACRAVYEFLHEAGLQDYYAIEAQTQSVSERAQRAPQIRDGELVYFDDPSHTGLADDAPGRMTLAVEGLHCPACVWLLERLPHVLPGVGHVRVDLGRATCDIEWDRQQTKLSTIAAKVRQMGYELAVRHADESAGRRVYRRELLRLGVAAGCTGNVMLVSVALYLGERGHLAVEHEQLFHAVAALFSIPTVLFGGAPFARRAWAGLRARRIHIDLPLSLGILAGWLASWTGVFGWTHSTVYFDSVCMLITLLLVGRAVQTHYTARAHAQADLLAALLPETARRIGPDDQFEVVATTRLAVGDRLQLEAGDSIAADGELLDGALRVDMALLTGEAWPVEILAGEGVLAGARVLEGHAQLGVNATGADSRVGQIAERLGGERRESSPSAQFSDKLASRFVTLILAVCAVAAVFWAFWDAARALEVVIAILVVSCPCALGLAPPIALAIARSRAARAGMLMPSLAALDGLAGAREVVFDKTGTLTQGRLSVQVGCREWTLVELAACVLALERGRSHPVARALASWASRSEGVHDASEIFDVVDHPGRGVAAQFRGRSLRIGSLPWIAPEACPADFEIEGASPVLVEWDARIVASFAVRDRLRPGVASMISQLRALGLRIKIVSGDHAAVVADMAESLGIADWQAQRLPEEKCAAVDAETSIMVGDGINDAAALRAAAVGVAVEGGAALTTSVADVHLSRGVEQLPSLIRGARSTQALIRHNIGVSLAYNAIFVVAAALGWVSPLAAAVLMPLSSLWVVGRCASSANFSDAVVDSEHSDDRHENHADVDRAQAQIYSSNCESVKLA